MKSQGGNVYLEIKTEREKERDLNGDRRIKQLLTFVQFL